jgi:replicative DNA helicase Mcm
LSKPPITSFEQIKQYLILNHEEQLKLVKQDNAEDYVLSIDADDILDHFDRHYNKKNEILEKVEDRLFEPLKKAVQQLGNESTEFKLTNFKNNYSLNSLHSKHVGRLISIKASIKFITQVDPTVDVATFECNGCMRLHEVEQININSVKTQPSLCTECGGRSFRLLLNESKLDDIRYVKLEDNINNSTSDREIVGVMSGSLANPNYELNAGDTCEIIGIFKIRSKDDNKKQKKELEFLIDIHNITPLESSFESMNFDEETEEKIIKLSEDPQIYERIVSSVAPKVHGHDDVKKALALQLFEGDITNNNNKRSAIHVLMLGDPGIGKSDLIKAVNLVAPKCINTSGAGASQVGLTATVKQDDLTKSFAVYAGAMPMADLGIVTIDEFDKLDHDSMTSLNDPMEGGSVHIAKAGLVKNLVSRTSVLAGANPFKGKLELDYKTDLLSQMKIPKSVLSRFDLIFLLEDKVDAEKDRKLARSILNQDFVNDYGVELIDPKMLTQYIAYAKKNIFPEMGEEAKELIEDFFVKTREAASNSEESKPFSPRVVLDLFRLSIAICKLRLSDWVTAKDAQEAIEVYSSSLRTLNIDVENAGVLENVTSKVEQKIIKAFEDWLLEQQGNRVTDEEVRGIKLDICAGFKFSDMNRADELFDVAWRGVNE